MKLTEDNYKKLANLDMCRDFRERLERYAPEILLQGSAEVSLEDIRDAKENAGRRQKNLLDKIFPQDLLEIGKWYKGVAEGYKKVLVFNNGTNSCYGFDMAGEWTVRHLIKNSKPSTYTEATTKEVEGRLKKEAVRRGFKGNKIKSQWLYNNNRASDRVMTDNLHYDNNELWETELNTSFTLYKNGNWAEIVKQEEIYKIGDRISIDGEKYLLVIVKENRVNLFKLSSGNRWNDGIEVNNVYKITQKEMDSLIEFEFKKIN